MTNKLLFSAIKPLSPIGITLPPRKTTTVTEVVTPGDPGFGIALRASLGSKLDHSSLRASRVVDNNTTTGGFVGKSTEMVIP